MSPGDFARGGAGLTIRWGWFTSPFGEVLAMGTDRGLCGMAFAAETGREAAMADLRARWPKADFREDAPAIAPWVQAALSMQGQANLHLIGAPFQIKVWEALLSIPSGQVTTYSDLAVAVGCAPRGAGGGHRRGPQPGQLADPLPPRVAQIGRAWRLSLGPAGQARDAGLGSGTGRCGYPIAPEPCAESRRSRLRDIE